MKIPLKFGRYNRLKGTKGLLANTIYNIKYILINI